MTQWRAEYRAKLCPAEEAVRRIASGQRIFIGSSCGEPQHLINALLDQASRFSDLEIVRLLSLESSIMALMAEEGRGRNFNVRSIYQGSGGTKSLRANVRFLTPMNLFAVPRLFKRRLLPLHCALIQVAPPDEYGWMSLGISVDVTLAAALSADCVIAQVNPRMPVALGQGFLHVSQAHALVEHEEDLLTAFPLADYPGSQPITELLANLVDDGSTIHLGLGIAASAALRALEQKNDLGVHTMFLTDGLMRLAQQGVITNRRKGSAEGKLVAGGAIGTDELYRYINRNPAIELLPSDQVNHPALIARNERMVSIQFATSVDLKGQAAADALPQNHFTGVTGMLDFVRGSELSDNGRSILVIPALDQDGRASRIVPELDCGAVLPSSDVTHVVSEFGAVNLFGKNVQERAMALISIAHPEHRSLLFDRAKELGLVGRERTLKESIYGVYPASMERRIEVKGCSLTLRPVKASDDRLIQEHFYDMDKRDIMLRFFAPKKSFSRDEMESVFQVDYVRNLSIVAIDEQSGFGRIAGLGVYMLEPGRDLAEVAFTVSKQMQGKGLATLLLMQLAQAARDNGIRGFVAYIAAENAPMIRLFKKLPFQVSSTYEDGEVIMTCLFHEQGQ